MLRYTQDRSCERGNLQEYKGNFFMKSGGHAPYFG